MGGAHGGRARPNILWILSDQHNPHVAGFAGNRICRTPNLDRLAASGTVFEGGYCQSPLCVPSRISMLTGKHVSNCSAWDNGSWLDPAHLSIAELLSQHGYTTALVGKAHLHRVNWKGGFDHRPYGDLHVGPFCFHQPDPPETWDGQYNDHKLGRFCFAGETRIPESLLADTVVTCESLAFLREHQARCPDQPWMLCAGYGRPHFPLTAPARYIRHALENPPALAPLPDGYPDGLHPQDRAIAVDDFGFHRFPRRQQEYALACYYAAVHYLDDCIGTLLHGLRRDGLLENTVIVYCSDHGDLAGEHGMWWKRSYYEASVRVPLIIAGTGVQQAGTVPTPVELVDLYPTFCELAGIEVPQDRDGESLLPLCSGRPEMRRKNVARADFVVGVEEGGGPICFRMIRLGPWKYIDFPEAPPRLFDLQHDPGEERDLIAAGAAETCGAPLAALRQQADACGTWDRLLGAMAADRTARRKRHESSPYVPQSATQYCLEDGTVVDGDAALYPGFKNGADGS